MAVNDGVISQGIVFAAILVGFSFSIAAQLLTAEVSRPGSHNSAIALFISGIVCLCAVGIGIVYFANEKQVEDQKNLGYSFVLLLVYALVMFLGGMGRMFMSYIKYRNHYWMIGGTVLFALIIVAQAVWVTR